MLPVDCFRIYNSGVQTLATYATGSYQRQQQKPKLRWWLSFLAAKVKRREEWGCRWGGCEDSRAGPESLRWRQGTNGETFGRQVQWGLTTAGGSEEDGEMEEEVEDEPTFLLFAGVAGGQRAPR